MRNPTPPPEPLLAQLRWPLRLTWAGMVAEALTRAFWPLWSVLLLTIGALIFGLQDLVSVETVWVVGGVLILLAVAAGLWGVMRLTWPGRADALDRLDRTLPGRPISALADRQAIGAGDAASEAVWRAHLGRMARQAQGARPVEPDLTLSRRDPFALRYVALSFFALALLFGSVMRVSSVAQMAPGAGPEIATGPSWEGWIEPPAHTGLPSLYLGDITGPAIRVAEGARISLRFYGEPGAIGVTQDVTGAPVEPGGDTAPQARFEGVITRSGTLELTGPGGRSWDIVVMKDAPPSVILSAEMEVRRGGEMRQPFYASDDYGVVAGQGWIELDLAAVDRRYGLSPAPEPRARIEFDLPMTISGDPTGFEETVVERFEKHPWAGLAVRMQLSVEDALGQTGQSALAEFALPARRFFDPLANAIAEQRRDLLWTGENGRRVAQVIRAVSYLPDGFIKNEKGYLLLRVALRRLEAALKESDAGATGATGAALDGAVRDEVAEMLWEAALQFEEGDLSSAEERLKRAQERLSEAMKNGATDDEIAALMQELREAMRDYMRELAEQGQRDGDQQSADNQNMMQMNSDQLQQMLDRLQQLMEEGRMAEAQQLMEMLRQMMENMQVTQGGPGQQSPGEQAMNDLAETLRDQQGLSDEAFRDLQEQFNPDARAGESQQNRGSQGGQGQGQQHDPQQGQGQGQGQGQQGSKQQGQSGPDGNLPGQQPGQSPGQQPGQDGQSGSLAERQGQLRDQLGRLERNLPGQGTEEGDAAREALGRAGEAMDRAEQALRDQDMAEALDQQSEAMEAMREGMRELGNAMARNQEQNGGQQGTANGDPGRTSQDPLGRQAGNQGRIGSDEALVPGEDVYRRARELLDEIRRRSSDQARPDAELDYLKRLLDRF